MSKAGRNDPCPCGSGKKYKKCCLEKAREQESDAHHFSRQYTDNDRASAIRKLISFSTGPEFESDHEIGFMLFWGKSLTDRTEEEMQILAEFEQAGINFNAWFLYDMIVEEGKTITDFFLDKQGRGLNKGESAYLKIARQTSLRLYEVHRVEKNTGFLLEDLWDGKRYPVSERAATHSFIQWDLMVTRLIGTGNNNWKIEGDLYNYPACNKTVLLKTLKKRYKQYCKIQGESRDDTEFFKHVATFFNHHWIEQVIFPKTPMILTAERDEMVLTRVVFDPLDHKKLIAALDASSEFEVDEKGHYIWGQDAPECRRILGNLLFRNKRLILETNSKERGEQGRHLLEHIASKAIRYRITEYQDIKQVLKSRKGESGTPSFTPEIEARIVKDVLDKYYRKWLSEKIPALSNRTPRHAVTLKTYRSKVINLLKDLENKEAHAATPGKDLYDFGWLWQELGLENERDRDS